MGEDISWIERLETLYDPKNPQHLTDREVNDRLGDRHRRNASAQKGAVAFMEAAERNSSEYPDLHRGWAVLYDWADTTAWLSSYHPDIEGEMIPVHWKDRDGVEKVLGLMGIEPLILSESGSDRWAEDGDFLLFAEGKLENHGGLQSTPLDDGDQGYSLHLSFEDHQTTVDFTQWVKDLALGDPRLQPGQERVSSRGSQDWIGR